MKVKVNRVRGGSMGDQRNYGLVTGSIWNYEDKPSTNEVSDTLGPVDRDQATIEAERGETVIYPDSDGQITHAKIGGKRHTHGGTPLDIPDGAFVFSDTRALLIKNKELLKNIFGMNTNKAVTPAKVAKRYDLNQYKDILNDPEADFLSKKTAQLMLENNLKKLGQLALVQEGMKGFPDGIPDIALPLFGSDIAVAKPMEQMPQAKFGGQIMRRGGKKLPKHQGEDYSEVFSSSPGYMLPSVLVEGYYPEWQQYIQRGLVDPNALPDEDESIKRQQVANAIKIYNDALKSGDVKAMKDASEALFKMDIEGWSTPGPWLSKGVRKIGQGLMNFLGRSLAPIAKQFETPLEDVSDSWENAGGYANTNQAIRRAESEMAQRAPSGAWTWQDKIYEMGRMLENFIEDKNRMEKTSSNAKSLLPKIEEYGKKKDEVVSKAEEILKNPKAYSPDLVYKAGEFMSEYTGENFWRGLLRDEKSFFEGPLTPEQNLDLYQFSPENWNNLYGKPIGIINKAYDDLVTGSQPKKDTKATERDIQKAATDTSGVTINTALDPSGKTGFENVGTTPAPAASSTSSKNSGTQSKTTTSKTGTSTGVRSRDQVIQDLIDAGYKKEEITEEVIQAEMSGPQGRKEGGVTYVFDPTNNIMLDRYQSNGSVKKRFNIYDKSFRDYASQNKLKLVLPKWATTQTTIGSQNPASDENFVLSSTGEIIPKGGIDKYTGPDDLIEWHKSQGMDFSKYVDADGNTAKDEADGMTKFKADLASWKDSGKKHRHATSWMLGKVDEINLERATKLGLPPPPSQTDKGVTGWDVTGFDVLTGTKYIAPEDIPPPPPPGETPKPKYKCVDGKAVTTTDGTGYDTAEEALKNCGVPGKVPTPQYTSGYPGRWSDYSEFNLATAMGMANQVQPGALPAFTQVFPDLGRPVFVDPTASALRQLALQNQQAEMIAGMSDPTVGRANIIASAAKTADPLSNIMANYDQTNAQIANTFEGQRAAMTNEAQVRNAAKREEFQDDLVTRWQNYENAKKEAAANVGYQYERGAKDFVERNALNAGNPNYGIDPYGRVFFKPGYNPNATASSTTTDLLDNYINNYNIDPNKAAALVAAQMKLNDNAFNYDPMANIWSSQKQVS